MTIIIKTINIDEIKKNNVYTFKPKNNNKLLDEHKIIINTKKKCSIQFKFNIKFIHNIKIVVGNNQYKIEKIDYKGVLINLKVSNKKVLEIIFIPDNECSNLNIWDLQIIDYDKLVNITWDRINIINLERRINRK